MQAYTAALNVDPFCYEAFQVRFARDNPSLARPVRTHCILMKPVHHVLWVFPAVLGAKPSFQHPGETSLTWMFAVPAVTLMPNMSNMALELRT